MSRERTALPMRQYDTPMPAKVATVPFLEEGGDIVEGKGACLHTVMLPGLRDAVETVTIILK
jgi:hypothetical protein